tara:strand:- start:4230 stop:4478 length:249 start_codon:yes stop_codon:yes gene_type:complete
MNNNQYFDTTWGAFDAIYDLAKSKGIESSELDNYILTGGISIGQSWSNSFEIDSMKGRNTRKGLHATIFRLETTYELVSYVL